MKLRGPVPYLYIRVSVSDLYIPTIGPQTQNRRTDRGNIINRSEMHECRNWEWGRNYLFRIFGTMQVYPRPIMQRRFYICLLVPQWTPAWKVRVCKLGLYPVLDDAMDHKMNITKNNFYNNVFSFNNALCANKRPSLCKNKSKKALQWNPFLCLSGQA